MTRTKKKTPAAQLDREIAAVLASPAVKISVSVVDRADDANEEESDEEDRYVVSDDGGEYDDTEELRGPDVQTDIDDRRLHYRAMGRRVVLDMPAGRGWE